MKLDIISYHDLYDVKNMNVIRNVELALLQKGIVGICDVPNFENYSRRYLNAARTFTAFPETIKQQYAPNREVGDTEGYELGAEWFKNQDGVWQIDDKKSSYYAYVPDKACNKWPREVDLKTPYLELGELIFKTGKKLLDIIGLNANVGLNHDLITGYGRMLHYHKENDVTNENSKWCGAHFDHGIFTGLMPAYYFCNGEPIEEPNEAGLYVIPNGASHFEKIPATDKSVLLFQVGEFGQLISNDRIKATKHVVMKAKNGIERYAFAVFYIADENCIINSKSELAKDDRYIHHQAADGSISHSKWHHASYARYLAKK